MRTRRKGNLLHPERQTAQTQRPDCAWQSGDLVYKRKTKEDEKIKIKLPLRQGMKGGSHHTNGDCTDASCVTPPKDSRNYQREKEWLSPTVCAIAMFLLPTLYDGAGQGQGQGRAGRAGRY